MKMSDDHSRGAIPLGLEAYKRTSVFTEHTIPKGLLNDHATKAGTWGLIHVLDGRLLYRVADPRRPALETILAADLPSGVVEPTIVHNVEPLGPVRFYVEFYRSIADPRSCCDNELSQGDGQQGTPRSEVQILDREDGGAASAATSPSDVRADTDEASS